MESSRFTKDQMEKLVQIMEQNPEVAKGICSNPSAFWGEVCKELNPLGPSKDKTGWRKAWADKKSNVKKKYTQMVQERNKTGGGIAASCTFTDIEERILNVTNIKTNAEGVEDTICIGVPVGHQKGDQQLAQDFHLEELPPRQDLQHQNQPIISSAEEELQHQNQEGSQAEDNQQKVQRPSN
ncbi:uncharacterized protein LOC131291216 [Anopheles ziemanni]|uniref:uncharacterized protein LOC131269381 n=1 Tax=Anopheles coustani TaxID=139045 RepID=UPI002658CC0A|nr:uncharacterized protein LOC131269381 [Anopheles coustani]XP_058176388.1 uncharacterized protein LOC131291216 [Anopheles ziemanni]